MAYFDPRDLLPGAVLVMVCFVVHWLLWITRSNRDW